MILVSQLVKQLAQRIPWGHTYNIQLECIKSLWGKKEMSDIWNALGGPGYGGLVLLWMIKCMICRGKVSYPFLKWITELISHFLYYACEYLHFATQLYFLSHFFRFFFFFSFLDAPLPLSSIILLLNCLFFLSHSSCFFHSSSILLFCEHNQTSLLLLVRLFFGVLSMN